MNKPLIDLRLEQQKCRPRAMQSYVMTLYEFVLELAPDNILEIGTQRGQSTKTMLMALNVLGRGKLVSVDRKNRIHILDAEHPELKKYWEFITGDSHKEETLELTKNVIGEENQYDMLFIDGDHMNPGVQKDWDDYTPLVKPGGIIMMHDITNKNADVKDVWAKITWEKFGLDWGRAGGGVIPGFGIIRKPNI